jgi:hypothetical protein
MANTILLKGRGTRLERSTSSTITPGMLVDVNSSDQLIPHAGAGAPSIKAWAVENDLEGKEIGDNYVANDYVQSEIMRTGDEVLGFLQAGSAAVVIGDKLEAHSDGSLKKLASGVAIAQALEALDNSAGGAMARLKMRVL